MRKHGKAEDKIYQFVCKNPGINSYQISKRLKMSGGNVRAALKNLHKKGLIFFKFERKSYKIEKKCFAVKLVHLLPKVLKKEIKNLAKV
ncbi:MAG: winged helix-turn-helix domain-containing protein [Candidatus Aenigmarchaeota archaeon]|nr:winged helix-turn-helix domain-containing protein [Candidatus Aenigmarchaeota archaeon]